MDSSYPSENSARVIGRLQGIGTRLAGSFGLVLILCVAMATLGLLELRRITALEVQLDSLAQRKQAMEQWKGATSVNLARALAIAHSAYQADVVKAFDPLMKETTAHISVLQKGLEDRIDDEAERQAFAAVGDKRKAYVGLGPKPANCSTPARPTPAAKRSVPPWCRLQPPMSRPWTPCWPTTKSALAWPARR